MLVLQGVIVEERLLGLGILLQTLNGTVGIASHIANTQQSQVLFLGQLLHVFVLDIDWEADIPVDAVEQS